MSKQFYLEINGLKVEVSEEVYREYKRPMWREVRNKRNRFRCRDGKGSRCNRNCLECERYLIGTGAQGFDLSLDDMEIGCIAGSNLSVDGMEDFIEKDRAQKVRKAVIEMDDTSRLIVQLLAEGFKQNEIADELGISASALNQRIMVIRKKLQKFNY